LINIAATLESTCETPRTENVTQNIPRYYVFVPRNPIVQNSEIVVEPSNLMVNIDDDVMLDVMIETTPLTLLSQEPPFAIGLLSLPYLPSKQLHGIKPLVDYSQSHVVTLEEHLQIMKQKVVEKVAKVFG